MSFACGNDVTAHPVADHDHSKAWARVASAAILVPLVLGIVYAGAPAFHIVLALVTLLLAREWDAMCGGEGNKSAVVPALAAIAIVAVAAYGDYPMALAAILAGIALSYGAARWNGHVHPLWSAAGVLYIGLPAIAMVWLRAEPEFGRATMFWLLGVVWAMDTGGFLVGRAVGGPRLAPAISPNKTWAGLFGGLFFASMGALVVGTWIELRSFWLFITISAALALVTQAGDLVESKIKRHFGVKDSGSLIPGHGGMFDRLDGLLVAAPALALLYLATGAGKKIWL